MPEVQGNNRNESNPQAASSPRRSATPAIVVMKFGGTSVEDSAAIRRVTRIVRSRTAERPVVVVSAMARVTDQLVWLGEAASTGRLSAAVEALLPLRLRHDQAAGRLVAASDYVRLQKDFDREFDRLEALLRDVAAAGVVAPEKKDELLSYGERLSSMIVVAAFVRAGLNAVLVDARDCIITDAAHTKAAPLWDETNERLHNLVRPFVEEGRIPVLGGFLGATREGVPTTLGRGGSDYSAAIVGAGLDASRIEIWTDVDGIMTADPRLCPDARSIAVMTFDEAADLAHFGAKVLHPATVAPAKQKNIPVWILNSRRPEARGTKVVAAVEPSQGVPKSVTAKKGITVVNVRSSQGPVAPGFLRRIFEVFERHHTPVDMAATSENSVSLTVDNAARLPQICAELRHFTEVHVEDEQAILCVVGDNLHQSPGLAARVYSALKNVNVRIGLQGTSLMNLGVIVTSQDVPAAVAAVHRELFPASAPATA
jgi:aspartate kinase